MRRIRLWALLAISAAFWAACAPKGAETLDPAFANYVKAYTGGVVNDGTAIRIELATPVPMDKQTDGLFSFKPALKGSERWLSPTVVEFVPDSWKSGTVYEGSFQVGKVLPVQEAQCQVFPFRVQAAPHAAALALDGVTIRDGARLQGTITLSVPAAKEDIALTVDPAAPVTVAGEGTQYHFEAGPFERSTADTPVTITLKVKDFDKEVSRKTYIPASGGFKVIDTRVLRGQNPCVEVRFSEPLSPIASREGLIELAGARRQAIDIQDNIARVYFDADPSENLALTVHQGVQSADGKTLAEGFRMDLPSTDPAPAVTIPIDGTILPDDSKLVLPFRAVNLSAVDLRVIKIYEDNVLLFLQENSLAGNSELRRVGRVVYSRQIPLTDDGVRDPHAWNDYSVDLSGLFKQEPGAIYRITLSFRQEYSLYGGKKAPSMLPVQSGKPTPEEEAVWDVQNTYWWDNYMDWEQYDWKDRNNPETPSYYMDDDRFPSINLLSSNLGLLAQYADGNTLWVAATDLGDAKPASGVDLEVYDFQLQRIGKGHTDGKGLAQIDLLRKPFILLGRKGKTTGYLRLADGYEKSMSRFDVGGQTLSKGLKGFIYGERGVWRPGDTLHVTMILADKAGRLPEGHPATLELYTPEGQFYTRMVSTGQDGFYTFPIATSSDDPTGWWNAYVKVGGSAFHKSLHIETVKPNRLKVNLELPGDILLGGARNTARVTSSWLTGVPASGLRASATMTLSKGPATFKGFDGYTFRNPASSFENSEYSLFETTLDGNGFAETAFNLPAAQDAPGLLQAFIVTSVLESGGDESFTTQTVPYSPFPAYVGVKLPEGDLETDKDNTVRVAVVDATGARLSGRELEYRVFKTEWSWWWDNNPSELAGYVNGRNAKPVASGKLTSGAQDVTFNLRAAEADWGRYLVVVRDVAGGHMAGKTVVIDWPAYKGRSGREDPSALAMLTFAADKESYRAGEQAKVYIPAAQGGQALVSLENAAGVIAREWVATDASKDTPYTFTVTPEMAPNFYVHITLVRPYEASEGGQPLRLYGVKRLLVENPASHLEPVVKVADTVAPEEAFTIQVSEKSGKPMTYTLAIVDEGLLDLTAFKTPSPWDAMYQTEALGVKTWDLYDEVIGAFASRFSPMLSIGGDQENIRAARKDNRFNPVVKFLGPFTLQKGAGKHEVKLPMYVGSLRVMVVAGHDGAYGNAATTVTVKSPLMVLATLPRQIATGEKVTLPVNVFALDDKVKDVKVTVKAEGALQTDGATTETTHFDQAGDNVVRFALRATGEGSAQVTVTAEGGSRKTSETIDIQVVNPNPETVTVRQAKLTAGESVSFDAEGNSTLALASFPAVDAAGLFRTMKNYPYSCSEQLSSKGLTMLHLLPQLSEADSQEARELIPGIIHQLYARQRSDGGFSYWSGGNASDTWASSMAGQFLAEAAAAGFEVQKDVLTNWQRFQTNLSQAYRLAGNAVFNQLDECYRLYTLAVAGAPANAAMNRLKESGKLEGRAEWMLAAAYAVSGKVKTAQEIVAKGVASTGEYGYADFTYGSSLRDKAVVLQVHALSDNLAQALPTALEVAEYINNGYYSTQEAAFAAMAMDRLFAKVGSQSIKAQVDGKDVVSAKSVYAQPVSGRVTAKNTGDGTLYVTLTSIARTPAGVTVPAEAHGLQVSVVYQDASGKALKATSIPQGTEFRAIVKVTNPTTTDYRSLALSERVPSGWEILNDRLRMGDASEGAADYRDIRDDRCDWFFDLPHGASKTFTLKLRAAYEGSYTLPAITCSAMYNPQVSANTESQTTAVTR